MGVISDYYKWLKGTLRRYSLLPKLAKVIKIVLVFILVLVVIFCYFFLKVFPEVGMVYNSQCMNPVSNWDGKLFNKQICENNLHERQASFSVHDPSSLFDRRRLRVQQQQHHYRLLATDLDLDADSTNNVPAVEPKKITFLTRMLQKLAPSRSSSAPHDFQSYNPGSTADDRPVILWGSHHKTGTYLAQKIFSRLCERMKWCCVFHVTRDSINSVEDSLKKEKVHVLGHSQWIWMPSELNIKNNNYKFVHFYRGPLAKIISGFRYHGDGVEGWTQKTGLAWRKSCPLSSARQSSLQHNRNRSYRYSPNRNQV